MSELLSLLRDEALDLVETELPEVEQVRPVLGALVSRLERLADKIPGLLDPAPKREAVDHVAATHAVAEVPGPVAPVGGAVQGKITVADPDVHGALEEAKRLQAQLASQIATLEQAETGDQATD